ncbi:MAG: response regulator [Lachnospiraceae bacterium]|nr:response regulator [Lachnospiraceae bacterium]
MSLYKVLLVDDEEEVREAIRKRIDWESIGFTVVGTAENGEEALELADTYEPDVVMTDIQMPFMDGITMLKKLKEKIPDLRSVIFSGYDDFEYAKEAIRLESEEYILKPVDADELREIFIRIKMRLDEQIKQRRNVELLSKYYEESRPMMKEQLIIGLFEGRELQFDLERYQRDFDLHIESAFYCAGAFRITVTSDERDKLDKNLMALSLKQMVIERFAKVLDVEAMVYLDTVCVLARLKSTQQYPLFIEEMDKICKIAHKSLDANVCAGIGRVYGNAESIHISFNEAKDAFHHRIFVGENQAICIKDVDPSCPIEDYVSEKQIRHIMRQVKVGTKESLEEEIRDFVEKLKKSDINLNQLQIFYAEFVVELLRLSRGHSISLSETGFGSINTNEELAGFSSMDEFADRLIALSEILWEKVSNGRLNTTKKLAEDAKQYISDHYGESSLSVDEICSHLGVGTSYFSSVFKKETGTSFVTYLTQVRMNEAQKLLDTTDEKSYIIAGMVGYEEPNYFSYVFKKHFGISPSRYRQ